MASASTKRPLLGCELTAGTVMAARANDARDALTSVAARSINGALAPSLSGANIQDARALRAALEEAFAALEARGRDIVLVLPDSSARVMLLDFDTLPERASDAAPLIRFRLKKLLPFDVDQAVISYQVQRPGAVVQVVAAVTQASVMEEYEALMRDIGLHPGVVLPS